MVPAPLLWRARVPLVVSGVLILAGVGCVILFIDAAVRATVLVDMVPGGAGGNSSQLDAHYRTMVWTLAAWVGALGAGILTLILTVRRLRSG